MEHPRPKHLRCLQADAHNSKQAACSHFDKHFHPVELNSLAPAPMVDLDGIWNVHSSSAILRAPTDNVGYYYNQNAFDVTMSTGFYNNGAGVLHAGEMARFAGNGPWKPTTRWRAAIEGDYAYSVAYRRVSNALLGVYVATGSGDNGSGTVASLNGDFITDDNLLSSALLLVGLWQTPVGRNGQARDARCGGHRLGGLG